MTAVAAIENTSKVNPTSGTVTKTRDEKTEDRGASILGAVEGVRPSRHRPLTQRRRAIDISHVKVQEPSPCPLYAA